MVVTEFGARMSTKNIVIFGETGAGKSSVINLMAGQEITTTSPDMMRCTLKWEQYLLSFDGHSFKVFDTVGLEELQLGMQEYLDIIVNAHSLIEKLDNEDGIDLLLFCVRAGRLTATLQTNYRLFYEWLCEKKVPIVLVLTGLEREKIMEDWWHRNKHVFDKYDINVTGHACITAANKLDGRHQQLYEESRIAVRKLVIEHTGDGQGGQHKNGPAGYRKVVRKLLALVTGNSVRYNPRRKDVEGVLIKRCGLPAEAARQMAEKIKSDLGRRR